MNFKKTDAETELPALEYPRKLRYKAVVFDLDGVITKTAPLHEQAWKNVFESYLARKGDPKPFTHDDYLEFVDGKPRYEGVRCFLESRGIKLEYGQWSDPPEKETYGGVGNKKEQLFNEILNSTCIEIYQSTANFIVNLKERNCKIAVASSSKHCRQILEKTNMEHFFDARVDGVVSEGLKLKGKPNADIFTKCCELLGVLPEESVVVEDAVSGVQAGRNGKFGLVVGIDRGGNRESLLSNGADIVVEDMNQLSIWSVNDEFPYKDAEWTLNFDNHEPELSKFKETLTTLGNGYFATRGAAEESTREEEDFRYPATYIAGGYNRVKTELGGKVIETEDLVNFSNWTRITFRHVDDDIEGPWFSWISKEFEILRYNQHLNIRDGILVRKFTTKDKKGRITTITSQRFVHMKFRNVGAIKYNITPQNWSGKLQVISEIDASVRNRGVMRYRDMESRHFKVVAKETFHTGHDQAIYLTVRTDESDLKVCTASQTSLYHGTEKMDVPRKIVEEEEKYGEIFTIEMKAGEKVLLEKTVAICTSRERGFLDPDDGAVSVLKRHSRHRFYALFFLHQLQWESIWKRTDMKLRLHDGKTARGPVEHTALLSKYKKDGHCGLTPEEIQFVLRFHIFHLAQTCNINNIPLDVSVPARGLHGEAYRGHIFWDELFVLQAFNLKLPETSRSMILYRYHRLDAARDIARSYGCRGACYPWQSGSSGREETSNIHFNPVNKLWYPDNSWLQQHINIAVFYNVWNYYRITEDDAFLSMYGAEMLFEIALFWSSRCTFNRKTGRFEIHGVMGPDEFHEKYPGAEKPGLNNNSYTNVMVAWLLDKVIQVSNILSPNRLEELRTALRISNQEVGRWREISTKMTVVFHDDMVMSQFEGYYDLKELDWDSYRKRYGNIQRLDRILNAEGDSPDRYKVSKQADVCMLFALLSHDELIETLRKMGYPYNKDLILKNIRYYLQRSSHGSTMSYVVYSFVLYPFDKELAWNLFKQFLLSDICDTQGGTTAEGVHVVPMAASLNMLLYQLCGIDTSFSAIKMAPSLPREAKKCEFRFLYKQKWLDAKVTHKHLWISLGPGGRKKKIPLIYRDKMVKILPGCTMEFDLVQDVSDSEDEDAVIVPPS